MKKKVNLKTLKVSSFKTSNDLQITGGISGRRCDPADEPKLDTVLAAGCFPSDACGPSVAYYSECCPTW